LDKTDKLNQLSLENDDLHRNIKELDDKIDLYIKQQEDSETKNAQLKEEISVLLQSNKKQADLINGLKENLNEIEERNKQKVGEENKWTAERDDLIQEKQHLQTELYSYMNRLSDLQIHKENIELQFHNQSTTYEEKLKSLGLNIQEKEAQIEALKQKISEQSENFESKLEAELNQYRLLQEQNEKLTSKSHEAQVNQLKTEISELKKVIEEKKNELNKSSLNDISQQLLQTKNEEIDDLSSQITRLKEEDKRRIQAFIELEHELSIIKIKEAEEIHKLKIELDKRLKSEQELGEKLKEQEEKFEAHKEMSKKEMDKLSEEIVALENEKNELKSDIATEKEKVDSLQDALNKKDEECSQTRESLHQKVISSYN